MISKRSRNIILEIIKHEQVKTSDLASHFKVSPRSIRMDLEEIDYFLQQNGFGPLRHCGRNLAIAEEADKVDLIYRLINQKEVVTASYTKEERQLEILYRLMMSNHPVKIEDMAESLLVSKSTVVKDLEQLKQSGFWNMVGTLDGIQLQGDELINRKNLVLAFLSAMDKQAITELIRLVSEKDYKIAYKVYWRLFENCDLLFIIHLVEIVKSMLSHSLSDRRYLHVIGAFALMLKRLETMNTIQGTYASAGLISEAVIDKLQPLIESHLNCIISDGERNYLQYVMWLASEDLYMREHTQQVQIKKAPSLDLCHAVCHALNIKENMTLQSDICRELVLIDMEQELGIPTERHIINLYDERYLRVLHEVEDAYSRERCLDEDQYWRLAWHFIYCMEAYHKTPKKRVLIVSDKSASLNLILLRRLDSLFDVEIIGICGYAQVEKYRAAFPIDCILATMRLDVKGIDLVHVHPLLSNYDIARLKEHLNTPVREISDTVDNLYHEVIWKWSHDMELKEITEHLSKLLQENHAVSIDVANELETEIRKLEGKLFRHRDVYIMNIRNHPLVRKNMIIYGYGKPALMEGIHKILLIAVREEADYICFLEKVLDPGWIWPHE